MEAGGVNLKKKITVITVIMTTATAVHGVLTVSGIGVYVYCLLDSSEQPSRLWIVICPF